MHEDRTHVAVGIIYNKDKSKVLIAKRNDSLHLGGLWEFPGGKLEKDETVDLALNRELNEELGITVLKYNQLKTILHDYPDKKVKLDIYEVTDWFGKESGKENQEIEWVKFKDLRNYDFPEANKNIVNLLSLPALYLISETGINDVDAFLSRLEDFLSNGLKIFQLRLKVFPDYKRNLIEEIGRLIKQYDAIYMLNGDIKELDSHYISGIHMNSKNIYKYKNRPIEEKYILGASCHTEEDIEQANKINADYIFLSPVMKTSSHPDRDAMGWSVFNRLSRLSSMPVYALGGMSFMDFDQINDNVTHGIAMISSIWNSPDSAEHIKKVCN